MSSKYTLFLKRIPFLHVDLVLQWNTSHLTLVMGVQGFSLYLKTTFVKWVPVFISIYCCQQHYTFRPYETEKL